MDSPSARALPAQLHAAATLIAQRVAENGARAWVVGGPVRDLALGRSPVDLDMASALLPEQVELLFTRTSSVGKAFGTILVHLGATDVQVTTFRRERGFSDARRPDLVEYSKRVEEDARRRDFTCNALYLDPLNDELADPESGMADIRARRLRAVGDPRARFAEDGLRLVRLARFHAGLDFTVDAGTLRAARDSREALSGVSPERRLGELERIFSAPRSATAIDLLVRAGLLDMLLPDFPHIARDKRDVARRVAALRALDERVPVEGETRGPGSALGLAVLLEPRSPEARDAAHSQLEFLKPSRALRQEIESLWSLACEATELEGASRSRRIRFARTSEARDALRLARALAIAEGADDSALARWEEFRAGLSIEQRFPPAWLTSGDLERAGVPRGPRWKQLLEEAETEQLEGQLGSRDEALRWLEQRAAQS